MWHSADVLMNSMCCLIDVFTVLRAIISDHDEADTVIVRKTRHHDATL